MLAAMLMDVSSEMLHSLLPLFMVTTLGLVEGLAESAARNVKIFSGALSDYLGCALERANSQSPLPITPVKRDG
jgi:hypothetical protein